MFCAVFGGKDVTEIVKSLKTPFVVSIGVFTDPRPYVYKFLVLSQNGQTVIAGEHDTIDDLQGVFTTHIPKCTKLFTDFSHFVMQKKGLEIGGPSSIFNMLGIYKQALSMDNLQLEILPGCFKFQNKIIGLNFQGDVFANHEFLKLESYDFVVVSNLPDFQRASPNIQHILKKDGYCIVVTLKNVEFTVGFKIVYTQHIGLQQIVVAHKQFTEWEEDLKHDEKEQLVLFPDDVKQCPHCGGAFCKDENCSHVYCGLDGRNQFRVGFGCGRCFCFTCGKKLCSQHYDPHTGVQLSTYKNSHDAICCTLEPGFTKETYCPGGHSGHCAPRW